MLKKIFNYSILVMFCALLGFFYSYHLPDFKVWAIDKIDQLSTEKGPVRVLVSNIDFNIFPIGVSFNQVRVQPKGDLAEAMNESFIKEVRLSLNPFSFLTGLFQFSKVEIYEPNIHIKSIKALQKLKDRDSDAKFELKSILKVPLNAFTVYRMNLSIDAEDNIPKINLNKFSLEIENQKTSALFSLISPQVLVYDPNIADIPVDISIGSRFLVQENQILMSALKIKKGDSYILAAGYTESPISDINFDEINLKVKTSLQLPQLRTQLLPFLKEKNIPEVHGTVEAQTFFVKQKNEALTTESKFHFRNLKIEQYDIGEVIGQTFLKEKNLTAPNIQVRNGQGHILVSDLKMNLQGPLEYKANLTTKDLQLQELLSNLGLENVPVLIGVNANLPCSGKINQSPLVYCNGEVNIKDLRVYTDNNDIVTTPNGIIKGTVEVTREQVNTTATLSLGDSSIGKVKGYTHYKKGFHYDFNAESLNFSDMNLANLNLNGILKGTGSVSGNSKTASLKINANTSEFSIQDYYAGQFTTDLSYRKGHLKFNNLNGTAHTTKYRGDLDINLSKSTITGDIRSPYIELSDLQKALNKIVQIPVELYGGGTADVKFSGPLDFSKLSYNVKSKILNGNVAGESFDELVFDVTSDKGNVRTDRATLKKSAGVLTVTGTAKPDGQVNIEAIGSNFTLQSLNSFAKTELNMNADLNFKMTLTDKIMKPKTHLKGTLTNSTISSEPIDNSSFDLSFTGNSVQGTGILMGDKIHASFVIPLAQGAPFELKAKTAEWDFVPLIHLISSKSRAEEFSTTLSADIDLKSDSGLWSSNGSINIETFQIQRGIKELKNTTPIHLTFKNGNMNVNRFELRGDNTSLEARSLTSPGFPFSFELNGKVDLGLTSFLTPFFDDLRGTLALTTQISLARDKWKFLGSAFVTDGAVRVAALPHAFDSITADILFSDDKIILNRLSSDFANGKLTGNGTIEIKGRNDIRSDLYGKFNGVNLRVPDGVQTKGSGDFHITGSRFPYLFEGNYIVQSGSFTKALEDSGNSRSSFTRSLLLPESLVKKAVELVLFDFDIIFNKGVDVRNDFVESKAYGRLRIKGPPTEPILLGNIQLQRGGKFFFRDTEFEFETAELKFNDQNKTNPDIYISANAVVEENIENRIQRYEINMLVQGKTDNYSLTFSSNPPRSEKDIISLLALGMTTEDHNTTQVGENQLTRQSYEVGASILTKNKFGRDLKSRTGLEFKVSSAIDQRNNTPSPKITITKQWTPRVETSASRTFGELSTQDVKVEYQLNRNVSLIGRWEGREGSTATTSVPTQFDDQNTTDILGIDIEYKIEFK